VVSTAVDHGKKQHEESNALDQRVEQQRDVNNTRSGGEATQRQIREWEDIGALTAVDQRERQHSDFYSS
jgi:hypothetical protein